MGIEGGSSSSEIQNQEINRSNNEQLEQNKEEHQRNGEELEGNSTIDNEDIEDEAEKSDEPEEDEVDEPEDTDDENKPIETSDASEIDKPLSERLNDIYDKYYDAAENYGEDEYGNPCANLSPEEKADLVNELKQEYDKTPMEERGNTFVPESADYLKDETISRVETADGSYASWVNYNWPENDGFTSKDGVAQKEEATIQKDDVIDRVGHNGGRFTSPVVDGKAETVESRALPYHFTQENIENEPSYHQFKAKDDITPENIQDRINNIEDDKQRKSLQMEFDKSEGKTYKGEIDHAFAEGDGGGTQYHMPMSINSLMKLNLLEEI